MSQIYLVMSNDNTWDGEKNKMHKAFVSEQKAAEEVDALKKAGDKYTSYWYRTIELEESE